jgi:hypothetical protein
MRTHELQLFAAICGTCFLVACSDVGDSSAIPSLDAGSDSASNADATLQPDGTSTVPEGAATGDEGSSSVAEGGPMSEEMAAPTGNADAGDSGGGGGSPGTDASDAAATMMMDAPSSNMDVAQPMDAVQPAEEPDASSAVDSSDASLDAADATLEDAGDAGDAGMPEVEAGTAPTPCTVSPCAASGMNSVKCSGQPEGVCTSTEAAIVTNDIASGLIHGADAGANSGQLIPTSCYGCLNTYNCLDNAFTTGEECTDVTGFTPLGGTLTSEQNCIAVIACTFGATNNPVTPNCNTGNPDLSCYCGTIQSGPSCNSAENGPCAAIEAAGLGFAVSDGADIQTNWTVTSTSAGMANTIFACAYSNGCTSCLGQPE